MRLRTEPDGTSVVFADGELTIYRAGALKSTLLDAMEGGDRVELEFANVSNIDLACLQIIHSTFNGQDESGKRLYFRGGIPKAMTKALEGAGYPDGLLTVSHESEEVAA